MAIKRSKKEIAVKLVEINLIKNKNEILSKKSKSSRKSIMNSDDSDTEQVKEKSKKNKSKSKKSKSSDGNDLFDFSINYQVIIQIYNFFTIIKKQF